MGSKKWTREEERLLKEYYETMETGDLMNLINRSDKSIWRKAVALGLLKERFFTRGKQDIILKVNGQFVDRVEVRGGLTHFKELLERNAYRIRPAIFRGSKVTIEAE